MIDPYTAPTPNGYKASVKREELGLPHTTHAVDLSRNEQKTPPLLPTSPAPRAGALVADVPDTEREAT